MHKKQLLIFTLFLFSSMTMFGQNDSLKSKMSDFDNYFIGGRVNLFSILREYINYPSELRKEGKTGRVYYKVLIDTLGNISAIEIIRSFDERFNDMVVDAVKKTKGNWKVKSNNGIKQEYEWTDSVYFELR